MATVRAALTPTDNRAPVVIEVSSKELSGVAWVARFPTSVAVGDLIEPFRSNVNSFLAAISAAGGNVTISATYRPVERAYLMHYSSSLSNGEIAARNIPGADGVNIEWVHETEARSVAAASAMANAYGIAYPPALVSNHTRRTALDMTIGNMIGRNITDAQGTVIAVKKLSDLHAVGASFGVIKLVSDPPHWSDNGH